MACRVKTRECECELRRQRTIENVIEKDAVDRVLAAVARGQSDEAVVELCRDSKLAERFKAVLEDRIADAARQRKNERTPLCPAHCRYPAFSRVRPGSGPVTRRHSYGPSAHQQCLCTEYPEYPDSLSTRAPHTSSRAILGWRTEDAWAD